MKVEVVFALPGREFSACVTLPDGADVAAAVEAAQATGAFEEADLSLSVAVAVFGEVVGRDRRLDDGDRVELLRPLEHDPKDARRQRAREK